MRTIIAAIMAIGIFVAGTASAAGQKDCKVLIAKTVAGVTYVTVERLDEEVETFELLTSDTESGLAIALTAMSLGLRVYIYVDWGTPATEASYIALKLD